MIDLREDVRGLYRRLSMTANFSGAPETGGRAVMFLSARDGEGASSLAASFALLAAQDARKPVWLVDLDLRRNAIFREFATGRFASEFGGVGKPWSAMAKGQAPFGLDPAGDAAPPRDLFTAHRVGDLQLMVTQFDEHKLKPGQTVRIGAQPAWWSAARAASDWVVVDAPSLARSRAGLAIASRMDGVVLVVKADATPVEEVDEAKRALLAHGGRIAGAVLNRRKRDARVIARLGF